MRPHRELVERQVAREVALGVHRYDAARCQPALGAAIEQLRRAALSVQLNIAEGFAISRSPRCRYHFRIAYGSAAETTDLLDFLMDVDRSNHTELIELANASRRTQALTLRLWQES